MPLAAGSRLGPYEITAPIGAGGMGEVYKAHDTRLGRDVAIKLLHASISADPEARGRFEREARTISQLNHPNICVLYDVGAEADAAYLVMEFLEGESIAARIARGPIPPEDALDFAMQMADALDKAHRQGIVHRDLKPANVMLVKTGAARSTVTTTLPGPSLVKLLDFGLAKLAPPPAAGSLETVLAASAPSAVARGTMADPPTAQGTILGTFQYMAPEQVEARDVDARADIWAFGCVLYEMLTGRRAFEGRTQASMIASILERDPTPVAELQPLTPPALARVIRICLAKDPDARFQSAYDLLLQLQWIAEGGSAVGLPAPVLAHRKRRERTMWAGVAAMTLAIGAAAAWSLKPAPVVSNVVERFSFVLPEGQAFTRTGRRTVAVSPDGKRMAYVADKQLYLREMHQLAALPIAGTLEDPLEPAFSPDGQWIAYFVPAGGANFTLKKIQIGGGTPVPICPTGWPYGLSWHGNTLVFGQNSTAVRGVQSVPDTSGTPTTLVTVGATESATMPQLLANGLVLFTVSANTVGAGGTNWDGGDIVVQSPGEATRTVLVTGGTDARVVAGDRLVYYKGGTLFGISVDITARATRGGPVPIVEGVQSTTSGSGAGVYSVADNGTLVFVPGSASDSVLRQLVWVDRQGKEELIPAPEREFFHPRLSPTGDRIVVAVQNGTTASLYTWEVARKVFSQLTSTADTQDAFPLWSPAGDSVIYRSTNADGARIMRVSASGASAPQLLLDLGAAGTTNGSPESISQDGKTLTFRTFQGTATTGDVFAVSLDGTDQAPRPLLAGPMSEGSSRISPDGRWLLYTLADAIGLPQIFMRPYPNIESDRRQVSPTPAGDPIWARSGREIYFIDTANKIHAVPVAPGGALGVSQEILDNAPYRSVNRPGIDFDVAPDGRFLMVKDRGVGATAGGRLSITIVTHWIDELKARVK